MHYEQFADGTVKCIEDEIPFEVPENWEWCRINSISENVTDGDHQPPPQTESGFPFLVISNVSDGYIHFENTRYVSKEYYQTLSEYRKARAGDLLFTVTGSYGIPVPVESSQPFCFQRHIAIIRPCEISNQYLSIVLSSKYIKRLCDELSTGTAQKTVGLATLRNFLIPIPPANEQALIIDKVHRLLILVDEIRDNKNQLIDVVNAAKLKILDLAIRGRLVPQDPNDEPASALVERIRAEKEKLIQEGKIKRDKKESFIFKGEDNSYYRRTGKEVEDISSDLPFGIPDSWVWEQLGNLCAVNPRNNLPDNIVTSFIPMSMIEDGFSGKHSSESHPWKEIKSGFTHFQNGDIGIAKITPCFENRKSTVFHNLIGGYGAGTTELYILRSYNSEIIPEYLLALVKGERFISHGKQSFTGAVGQQRIGKDYVTNTFCPFPPVEEQKRIVEAISAYFAQLDRITDALV